MIKVVGIRFKKAGKTYFFDPDNIDFQIGDSAIVETSRGMEFGHVVQSVHDVNEEHVVQPLKKVIRKADNQDIERVAQNEKREKEAMSICQQKINNHKLDMKLVDVEYTFDNNKIVFYFTADGRVDFRELVKDLASVFRMRIELRQIGVRDEAKMLGGLGPCGRMLCCHSFLDDFQPVSVRMAKEQNLSLNPTKISGICSRLMCCLKYEQDTYEQIRRGMPKIGREVETPDGPGVVLEHLVVMERVKARVRLPDGNMEVRDYPMESIQGHNQGMVLADDDEDEPWQEDGLEN